jgi:thioredoxin type arsenate reductase
MRRITAETIGTALLPASVVGSGIMGERLSGGNVAIALLANTLATGAMLVALLLTFGPISGAHFNPAVTLADASQGGLPWREVPGYVAAQLVGAFAGVAAAHVMFGEPVFSASRHITVGGAQLFSEFIATFGLLAVIWGCARLRSPAVPFGKRYLRRNPARRCAGVHSGATGRSSSGNAPVSLAGAAAAERCRIGGGSPFFANTGQSMNDKKRVLILCTGNSARSQMAEGLLRHDAGERFDVESAGTKPGSVRPEAIAAMKDLGIDLSGHRSKSVAEFAGQHFDYVRTVCDSARETCPVFFGGAMRLHHDFDDPAALNGSEEERLALFRRVRDELRAYLSDFAQSTCHETSAR